MRLFTRLGRTSKFFVVICLMLALHATQADAGFQDFLKGAMKSLGLEQELTESEIVDGLKTGPGNWHEQGRDSWSLKKMVI